MAREDVPSLTNENAAMLVGLIMDRMGAESITLTKQDVVNFEGGIESEFNIITDSCTITRFK
ncbi:hypothetical protein SEA_ARGAN_62 [Arthrobacter phage Argan]|nr:hypothetical protein SEA_ARGAN_62 [Arthrobacter phage Argan]